MSNLLQAINNISYNLEHKVKNYNRSRNRANNMGEALELFIKDAFCNSFSDSEEVANEKFANHFSYLGNQNNPPDIMLKQGDAIEVKKVELINSGLALNSSYPKDKIYSNSNMITTACRNCENWVEKDIIYAVGVVDDKKINDLCFVYGEDYSASHEVYEKIKNTIKNGVYEIPNVEFAETNELARVNKVDPLGITYLRVRGMWGIENPFKVFNYVYKRKDNKFNFFALINEKKFYSFPKEDIEKLVNNPNINITNCKIKDPNNPAKLKEAKLITFKEVNI